MLWENFVCRVRWMRGNWIGRHFVNYFPMTVVKGFEGALDPTKNYLFANHPHGYMAAGVAGVFGTDATNFRLIYNRKYVNLKEA